MKPESKPSTPANDSPPFQPLALIGIGCLFPKAGTLKDFWSNIKGGVDSISDIPASHWSADEYHDADPKRPDFTYAKRGGFLSPVDFDPAEFGIAPHAIEATDSAQLLGLVAAKAALEDAGYGVGKDYDRSRVSVILGVTGTLQLVVPLGARLGHPLWRRALAESGIGGAKADEVVARIQGGYVPWQESSFPGLLGNVVAGRIANRFNLGGTNCVVDAACASSLSALHLASLELAGGRSSMIVTGGVDCFNDIFMFMCFSKTPALSPTGESRPFDSGADGTALGEGLGLMVLKRLSDAERDGDRIYAVLKGIGSSSDGRGKAIYAPSPEGQSQALREAYRLAGVSPATIELVEGHGTGTTVGDAAEIKALAEVYRASGREGAWTAVGSVKSQIGHTKAAAGSAGLIKAALSLHHKVLPPTIKVRRPIADVGSGPLYVNAEKRPWTSREHPRRAGVSSFGFGGSNFHAVLEEHVPEKSAPDWDGGVEIAAVSGADRRAVAAALAALALRGDWDQVRRAGHASRQAFRPDAAARLCLVLERGRTDPESLARGALGRLSSDAASWTLPEGAFYAEGAAPRMAVLFPGQGSQYVGMGRDVVCQFPEALGVLDRADRFGAGTRLSEIIYPFTAFDETERKAHEDRLRQTENAQPALGVLGLGMWRVLEAFGLQGHCFGGHSYGELTALAVAGVLSDADLMRLSRLRGKLMAEGDGGRGGMLAVFAPLEDIAAFVSREAPGLVLANKNAPAQGVLSGPKGDIAKAQTTLEGRGIRCVALPVSAAFHSASVAGAERPLAEELEACSWNPPRGNVYSNKTAAPYPASAREGRAVLAAQVASPVEFCGMVERLHDAGMRLFLECGPGGRLTGLVSSILQGREFSALAVDSSGGKRSGIADLAKVLARLAALGQPVALARWEEPPPPAPPASRRTVKLTGANHRSSTPPTVAPVAAAATAPARAGEDSPPLAQALRRNHESMLALQKMQETAAALHLKFLESQETAQRALQGLIDQHHSLLRGGGVELSAAPAAPVKTDAPASPPQASPETPPSSAVDSALLAVVSEKTGYPAESLGLDMDLESDLGIDSIKRVEILAALREKLPEAPAVKPEHLGSLRTLRQIAAFLGGPRAAETPAAPSLSPAGSVAPALLAVVSDKTGYPAESLGLDMDLESDLGIDSIKRVEILAALREKLPEAPAVKPEHLGSLRTLRQIAAFLGGPGNGLPVTAPAPERATSSASGRDGARLERLVLRLTELDPAPAAWSPDPRQPLWIACDDEYAGRSLAQELGSKGLAVQVVPVGRPAAWVPERLSGLVILAPARRMAPDGVWDAASEDFLKRALGTAAAAGPALRRQGRERGALFATVVRLDGAFGLEGGAGADPVLGGLSGLAKTAAREWPEVRCRALDLAAERQGPEAAAALARELLSEGPLETGLGPRGRRGLRAEALEIRETSEPPLRRGEVALITGGARGVTAEAALALGRAYAPTLVVVGRTEPAVEPAWVSACETEAGLVEAFCRREALSPREARARARETRAGREVRSNLERLRSTGAAVFYRAADLRDEGQARSLIESIRREHGPIRALVHGAGVLADKLIVEKTAEQAEGVFAAKLSSLRHLLRALGPEELRALALFSSTTARYGRVGQSDYAMANESLNKIARQHAAARPGCRAVSINWGPWAGGMVTEGLQKIFEAEGVGLVGLEEGGRHFLAELRSGGEAEVVVGRGLPRDEAAPPATAEDQGPLAQAPSGKGEQLPCGDLGPLAQAFSRTVSLEEMPVLGSHVINGVAVLPAALMVEWLAAGALHGNPGLVLAGLSSFRVLKGVRVGPSEARVLTVAAGRAERRDGAFRVAVALRGADGAVHADAAALLAPALPPAPTPQALPELAAYPHSVARCYRELLFHGPELAGLMAVHGVGDEAIAAECRAAPPPGAWSRRPPRDSWVGDPLALDCAFQALILWSRHRFGAGSLPSGFESYRQFAASFPQDGVRLAVRIRRGSELGARADVDFLSSRGALVARMEGCSFAIDRGLNAAFRRNTLETVAS